MGMTLRQAAETLGVSPDASKKEINDAYRKLIGKYHPDAHRNDPPAEQAAAEKMFKTVNRAKRILLDPTKADPEPAPEPRAQEQHGGGDRSGADGTGRGRTGRAPGAGGHGGGWSDQERAPRGGDGGPEDDEVFVSTPGSGNRGGRRRTQEECSRSDQNDQLDFGTAAPRPGSDRGAGAGTGDDVGWEYETPEFGPVHGFDAPPPEPDPAEEQLAGFYADDAWQMYSDKKDKFRVTPSTLVSIAFLVMLAACIMTVSGTPKAAMSARIPYLACAVAVLVKAGLFDMFASFHVERALSSKLNLGWPFECGVESLVLSIACIAVPKVMTPAGLNVSEGVGLPLMIVAMLAAAGLMIAGVVRKIQDE